MDKIYFSDLESISENNMLGSESAIYNCFFNNKFYLYKQPLAFKQDIAEKMNLLTNIDNPYLITPKFIIYGDNYQKPIGYLLYYLEKYKSLYYLKISKEEKIDVLKKVKEAIIEMHKLGIIHCDLHVANIMCSKDDVKIIDLDSSKYLNYEPDDFNSYSQEYLKINKLDKSVDIYNFNIDTFSCLNNIAWDHVFDFDYTANLNDEQNKIWQKTKEKKELTYDDFLIDRY